MKKKTIILFVFFITILLISGCVTNSKKEINEKKNIIVSILPQKAFVQAVGGKNITVKELISPGGNPTTYELKPSDLINVEKANVYFTIGHLPFEKANIDKFTNLNPNMKIINTTSTSDLLYFEQNKKEQNYKKEKKNNNKIDPHIWLAPMQVKKQIDIIEKTLSKIDSDNSEKYVKNAKSFKKKLDKLHVELKSKFKKLKTNKLMVFHPAWGYFAKEYGLEQIAIEQHGKEPTTEQLQKLIKKAKKEKIKVIFVQSQFNKKIAKSIADEIGAIVVSIDPLSKDYINNLKNVTTTITKHLNKK